MRLPHGTRNTSMWAQKYQVLEWQSAMAFVWWQTISTWQSSE